MATKQKKAGTKPRRKSVKQGKANTVTVTVTGTPPGFGGTPQVAPQRRPHVKYSDALAVEICRRIACGESLRRICRDPDMPDESTVRQWAIDDVGGFYPQYTRARDIALDIMADEVIELADTTQLGTIETVDPDGRTVRTEDMLGHRRLRFDARRWYLSKLAPKKYGEKLEHTGPDGGPMQVSINIK